MSLKQIILGTAGHIDHGKTSLIRAATGIETDRLKEEKERGITIELGYAFIDLPGGQRMGIVDVPGHEKFVKNMVAGATGIDLVAMVIAADEGVMPQTREHMEICSLLGVSHGFVALTKIDLVDAEFLELAMEDVRDFTRGTFLEGQPVVPVSSSTGEGIDDLIRTLDRLSAEVPERSLTSIFRLPVDRVFTMKGFGTVITGSLVSGSIRVGENVMIYPSGITSRVRGIQVHNDSVEEAVNGVRTAINFQGLEKASITRGEVLSRPGDLIPGYMLDVSLDYLKSNRKPIKNRAQVRCHTGTSEILGRLILLDRDELAPGDSAVAQLRLDEPVVTVRGDRFVIRSYSPVRTIGGGSILNPAPLKHKRFRKDVISGLQGILEAPPEHLIEYHARQAGPAGVSFAMLKIATSLQEKKLDSELQKLLSHQKVILVDKEKRLYIHGDTFQTIQENIRKQLFAYHQGNPLKAGMPKEELKSKLARRTSAKLFTMVINHMLKTGEAAAEDNTIRLASHEVSLQADQTEVKDRIQQIYRDSGLTPPYFKDLCKDLDMDAKRAAEVLMLLVSEGRIIKVKEDLFFHSAQIEALQDKLVDFLRQNGELSAPQFKEMTGVSRKYLIPLLEYYDARNVTIRVGDIRKLRKT